eukprot:6931079-Prymnesium_polylepis.1
MVHALAAALGCPSGPNSDIALDGVAADGARELALLERALPLLDKEYAWWMREGDDGSAVRLPAASGTGEPSAVLNRYVVHTTEPRPESWREDKETAAGLTGDAPARLYAQLAAGAETGWDYSTRWLRNESSAGGADGASAAAPPLQSIRTSDLIATDLNSILYKNERSLAAMYSRLALLLPDGSAASASANATAQSYETAASARLEAMRNLLWNPTTARWHDLLWQSGKLSDELTVAAYTPLWAGAHDEAEAAAAVASLRSSGLLQIGGAATTLAASGQQWDFPN